MKLSLGYAVFALLPLVAGCSSSDITDPSQIVFPAKNVSFAAQVQPYFMLSCSVRGCHDGSATTAGGVDLTSWIGVRAINVCTPGDTNSALVMVLYSPPGFQHSGRFIANDNQRYGIKQWVREGAQNN